VLDVRKKESILLTKYGIYVKGDVLQ